MKTKTKEKTKEGKTAGRNNLSQYIQTFSIMEHHASMI